MSTQLPDRADAQVDVSVDGVRLTVSVRVDRLPVVLGEPLTATWAVTSGGSAAFVALAADRITGRILGLSFRASLRGTDLDLADPTPEAGALGGPGTAHDLGTRDLTLPVLVDDYLDLGPLSGLTRAETTLTLSCHWDLQAGLDDLAVLGATPTPVSLDLELPLTPD